MRRLLAETWTRALEMMDPTSRRTMPPRHPTRRSITGGRRSGAIGSKCFALFEDFTIDIEESLMLASSRRLSAPQWAGAEAARLTRAWRTSGPSGRDERSGFGSIWNTRRRSPRSRGTVGARRSRQPLEPVHSAPFSVLRATAIGDAPELGLDVPFAAEYCRGRTGGTREEVHRMHVGVMHRIKDPDAMVERGKSLGDPANAPPEWSGTSSVRARISRSPPASGRAIL